MNADQGGEDRVVSFQEWNTVLGAAPMSQEVKTLYRKEIISFLHHCKVHHAGASIMLIKEYLAVVEGQRQSCARVALRWWFRAGEGGRPKEEGRTQSAEGEETAECGNLKANNSNRKERKEHKDRTQYPNWNTEDTEGKEDMEGGGPGAEGRLLKVEGGETNLEGKREARSEARGFSEPVTESTEREEDLERDERGGQKAQGENEYSWDDFRQVTEVPWGEEVTDWDESGMLIPERTEPLRGPATRTKLSASFATQEGPATGTKHSPSFATQEGPATGTKLSVSFATQEGPATGTKQERAEPLRAPATGTKLSASFATQAGPAARTKQERAEPLRAPATGTRLSASFATQEGPATGNAEVAPYQTLRPNIPPLAATDMGRWQWECDLIRACRERGFLWRTEETYRQWAGRFAGFLRPRTPYIAKKEDVAAFLSKLAVTQRASSSTQKQALNAIVFLIQEALHHDLGELDFDRARTHKRVPTVLSPEECDRLFAQLTGTPRLMAELAYGAGLRLMELIRLRVHHLDLDRLQVQVRGGKGDKDRITVLPASLVEPLREHLGRLRVLYAQDRAEERPGVWLPEGLARKYPKAGVSWEWQWLFSSREFSVDPVSGVLRRHHVQDGAVQGFVRRAARAAQIDKRVTPHVLRHSFGTHMMENGHDIRTVQELMGHSDVRTTQMYTHVMQKGLGSVSPLDKLRGGVGAPNAGYISTNWPMPPAGAGPAATNR